MAQRNHAIDFMRFLMAFLVVVIHVPLFCSSALMPAARCAVPFFYMVSGYFLWHDNVEKFTAVCMSNAAKWFKMWLWTTVALSVVVVLLKVVYPQPIADFSLRQLVWMTFNGVWPSLERIDIDSHTFGTSVLWFLYCGAISMFAAKYLHGAIKHRQSAVWIVLLVVVGTAINKLADGVLVPRLISAALPFTLLGAWLRCHEAELLPKISFKACVVATVVLYVASGLEMMFSGSYKELTFATPLLSTAIFIVAIKFPIKFAWISKIPVKCTFDIYIYIIG